MKYPSYTRLKQQKRLRDRTERGKCTNKREKHVGLSTLVKPFHTEHNSPDVIGLDNVIAMPLANQKQSPMKSLLHYLMFLSRFFLPAPKSTHTCGSIMLPPHHPHALARVTCGQLIFFIDPNIMTPVSLCLWLLLKGRNFLVLLSFAFLAALLGLLLEFNTTVLYKII